MDQFRSGCEEPTGHAETSNASSFLCLLQEPGQPKSLG